NTVPCPKNISRTKLRSRSLSGYFDAGLKASSTLAFANAEQRHAVLHRSAIPDVHFHDLAGGISLNFVHQLHGFNDAEHLALFDGVADRDERRGTRRGRFII